MLLAFTAPAFAQVNLALPTEKMKTQDQVDRDNRRDQDYKATLQKLPDQKASDDPWGNVRSTAPAAAEPKARKKKTTAQQQKP
ncbi:MAG TPA: hypothetical protein VKX28_28625 [Xanthobacteraceae bacterium]|nr:hypothetical protein [Xanthobacteraceae bacterium]